MTALTTSRRAKMTALSRITEQHYACPACGALAGHRCRSILDNRLPVCHNDRIELELASRREIAELNRSR
jgi:hypothetical protein